MPRVAIATIKADIRERQREDMGDIEGLAASLEKFGQLEPVGLDTDLNLIYGMRRLTAAIMLGWDTINAELIGAIDPIRAQEIELRFFRGGHGFAQFGIIGTLWP